MDRFLAKPVSFAALGKAVADAPAAQGRDAVAATDARDAALRQRLLKQYAEETPAVVADIVAAARDRNWGQLRRRAHYLKNSADALGARWLQHYCRELQLAADEGDERRIEPLVAVIQASWHDPCRS
ncbi:MAG: Hpt domain-containing protein [Opitutae bacterium]|nr:Hpt domain-containing protein [Opitutae bacterium]